MMMVGPGPNFDLSIACDCGAHDYCGGSSQRITTCGQQGGSCKCDCHTKEGNQYEVHHSQILR